MENKTNGTVISVKTHYWLKVNTKAVRSDPLDGATFPHTVLVKYSIDGKEYVKKKWLSASIKCPSVGESVTLIYDESRPQKAELEIARAAKPSGANIFVSVISIISSVAVFTLVILQLLDVFPKSSEITSPLIALILLCQAYLQRHTNRKLAIFCVAIAILISACALAIFLLK